MLSSSIIYCYLSTSRLPYFLSLHTKKKASNGIFCGFTVYFFIVESNLGFLKNGMYLHFISIIYCLFRITIFDVTMVNVLVSVNSRLLKFVSWSPYHDTDLEIIRLEK